MKKILLVVMTLTLSVSMASAQTTKATKATPPTIAKAGYFYTAP